MFVETQKEKRQGDLPEVLGLGPREVISLVGAGGKTSLMFRLAKELVSRGRRVVTTTTTKILEPSPEESPRLFVSGANEEIGRFLRGNLSRLRHITVARERLGAGKLKGIPPEWVDQLAGFDEVEILIVEADGAAGRPVKAPREGEPVVASSTTLTVALTGVDGLGLELREDHVFRSERVARLTGLPLGAPMSEQAMAAVITHPDGILKGVPHSSRIVVFLNKVDIACGVEKGERIAVSILEQGRPGIERVILGQLRQERSVVKTFWSRSPVRTSGGG